MSVETTARKENFAGGQGTLTFSFRALVSNPEDIKVKETVTATGVESDLAYGVDYTVAVSADGVGGVVTVLPTFSTAYTQTVYRETTVKQESDYDDYNQFPADTLEESLDRLTMVSQEIQETVGRSLSYPIASTGATVTLPSPLSENFLRWNTAGTDLENAEIPDPSTLVKASVAEAQAGTEDTHFMTPSKTKDAINALSPALTKATSAEATAGTESTHYMTPSTTTIAINALSVLKDGTVNPTNLLANGDFESWSAGASAAPDGWVLAGAGASVARATSSALGVWQAGVTRGGADTTLTATPFSSITANNNALYRSRAFTLSCWVYATVAGRAYISITDGVGGATSVAHTGGSGWELLTVTYTTSASATELKAVLQVINGNTTVYFDGAMCVEGSSAFAFSPKPAEEGVWADYSAVSTIVGWASFTTKQIYTKKIGKTVFVAFNITGTSNATGGSFTVPYTCANDLDRYFSLGYSADNGTATDGIGYVIKNTAGVNLSSSRASAGWTNSGVKSCIGQCFYEEI